MSYRARVRPAGERPGMPLGSGGLSWPVRQDMVIGSNTKGIAIMDSEFVDMQRKLDELGQRVTEHERRLRLRGTFTDMHATRLRDVKDAHARLSHQLAQTSERQWSGFKDEFVREYDVLTENLRHVTEYLDEQQMKSPRK